MSFGYSQCIVLYHYFGDHTATLENIEAVRDYVFSHPAEDIDEAASRLACGISRSLDGTALGGMIVYNAGSDRRDDPEWLKRWKGNVANYEAALAWAEQYRP